MDDSNELAQAIAGNFMMLLCKYGEVSAPVTLELILKWGLMLAKYVLLINNKNMFVLITDEK